MGEWTFKFKELNFRVENHTRYARPVEMPKIDQT